jgi:hypothetical protein
MTHNDTNPEVINSKEQLPSYSPDLNSNPPIFNTTEAEIVTNNISQPQFNTRLAELTPGDYFEFISNGGRIMVLNDLNGKLHIWHVAAKLV